MTMDVTINNDNDIALSVTLGIDDQYASMLGGSDVCTYVSAHVGSMGIDLPGDVTMTPGASNAQQTCTISATGLTLNKLNSGATSGSSESLTHANGQYTFTMSMGDAADMAGVTPDEVSQFINPFAISVTFPGAVVSSNPVGTVSGNKVTWDNPADLLGSTPLTAVGKDSAGLGNIGGLGGSGSGVPWGLIIGIVVAVIVIAAIVVLVLMTSKRKKAQAAAAMQAQYAQAQYAQYAQYGQYGQPYPAMPQYAPQPPYGQPMPQQPVMPQPVPQPPAQPPVV